MHSKRIKKLYADAFPGLRKCMDCANGVKDMGRVVIEKVTRRIGMKVTVTAHCERCGERWTTTPRTLKELLKLRGNSDTFFRYEEDE